MDTEEKNLSICGFWWTAFLSSFKGAFGKVRAIMYVIAIILSILFYQHPKWGSTMNTLTWALPLGIFIVFFIPSLLLQSHYLYKQKANKLGILTKKEIDLVVIPNDKQYLLDTNKDKVIARVGIKTTGISTVKAVGVILSAIDDIPNPQKGSLLSPANCSKDQLAQQDINFGDIYSFVEVFVWDKLRPNEPVYIQYYQNCQNELKSGNRIGVPLGRGAIPCSINIKDIKKHKLTLQANGQDILPVTREFIFEISESGLLWYEVPKNN
jgi:hypothetical protein